MSFPNTTYARERETNVCRDLNRDRGALGGVPVPDLESLPKLTTPLSMFARRKPQLEDSDTFIPILMDQTGRCANLHELAAFVQAARSNRSLSRRVTGSDNNGDSIPYPESASQFVCSIAAQTPRKFLMVGVDGNQEAKTHLHPRREVELGILEKVVQAGELEDLCLFSEHKQHTIQNDVLGARELLLESCSRFIRILPPTRTSRDVGQKTPSMIPSTVDLFHPFEPTTRVEEQCFRLACS